MLPQGSLKRGVISAFGERSSISLARFMRNPSGSNSMETGWNRSGGLTLKASGRSGGLRWRRPLFCLSEIFQEIPLLRPWPPSSTTLGKGDGFLSLKGKRWRGRQRPSPIWPKPIMRRSGLRKALFLCPIRFTSVLRISSTLSEDFKRSFSRKALLLLPDVSAFIHWMWRATKIFRGRSNRSFKQKSVRPKVHPCPFS